MNLLNNIITKCSCIPHIMIRPNGFRTYLVNNKLVCSGINRWSNSKLNVQFIGGVYNYFPTADKSFGCQTFLPNSCVSKEWNKNYRRPEFWSNFDSSLQDSYTFKPNWIPWVSKCKRRESPREIDEFSSLYPSGKNYQFTNTTILPN